MRSERKNARELFEELNDTDESEALEAKSIRYDSPRSLLETICSFSNEPNLDLSDGQKMALVFLREVGAVDNNAYRQLSGLDTLRASYELRRMRDLDLVVQKGKGNRTYYIAGERFPSWNSPEKAGNSQGLAGNSQGLDGNSQGLDGNSQGLESIISDICRNIGRKISASDFEDIVVRLCSVRLMSTIEIAKYLDRAPAYVATKISTLVRKGKLHYRFPMMPNHPEQAYGVKGKTL